MIKQYLEKYQIFVKNIALMDEIFHKEFKNLDDQIEQSKPFSKCGKCNRLMKLVEKAHKVHCEHCNVDYNLPENGKYKTMGEKYCPYDKFQILLFTYGQEPHNSFYMCPYCYVNSPCIESQTVSCSICINKECQFSLPNNLLG